MQLMQCKETPLGFHNPTHILHVRQTVCVHNRQKREQTEAVHQVLVCAMYTSD